MLPEPKISYKPFWGICRPLNSWRANSPNPIQIYCARRNSPIFLLTLKNFDPKFFQLQNTIDSLTKPP